MAHRPAKSKSGRATTLKDIARELGLSQMTVSRALRGVDRTSPGTRARVLEVAKRLNYSGLPGVMSRPAVRRSNRSHKLRLLLPTVSKPLGSSAKWYLDRMLGGIAERLARSNGAFEVEHFDGIEELLTAWQQQRYHGIVLRQPLPQPWIARLLAQGPVVYGVEIDHQLGVDAVYSNEFRSTAQALDLLSAHGHRSIAWLGILDQYAPYQVVYDALEAATVSDRQAVSVHGARHATWTNLMYQQHDTHHHHVILVDRDWRTQDLEESVARGLQRILDSEPRPTAVVCSCDPVAEELLLQLQSQGLGVPGDMSVMSYGGSDIARGTDPPITSLEMPMETIGRMLPELVERRLADPEAVPVSIQFETTLFPGASIGPVHAPSASR